MQDKPILQVGNLKKQYGAGCPVCTEAHDEVLEKNYCPHCGTVYACQDISFDFYEGEILGIVGESGSGKSTMMQCLYFDESVTSGAGYMNPYRRWE